MDACAGDRPYPNHLIDGIGTESVVNVDNQCKFPSAEYGKVIMTLFLSPPVVLTTFLLLSYLIYWLGGKISARSEESPGKHEPYACGEDLTPSRAQLSYHAFFRLALMFGLLHVSALVLTTLPMETTSHRIALIYIVAVGISVYVLAGRE